MGYVQYTNDPCIYTLAGETIIGVYVDDFVIAGESSERIEQVKTSLSEKFDVKISVSYTTSLEYKSFRITKGAQSG